MVHCVPRWFEFERQAQQYAAQGRRFKSGGSSVLVMFVTVEMQDNRLFVDLCLKMHIAAP